MTYDHFQYLYPPRPKTAVHPKYLSEYADGSWMAQPKLNGDCAVIFTNGTETHVRDRHKDSFSKNVRELEAIAGTLHRGKEWLVLVGEWMTKSKKDCNGTNFNGHLVLFDILVYNGVHLSGYSFEDRYDLLMDLYQPTENYDPYILRSAVPNVFVVETFDILFPDYFEAVSSIDMYEGLVLKKRNAKLELGVTENNNIRTQVKFRKPAKNYHY